MKTTTIEDVKKFFRKSIPQSTFYIVYGIGKDRKHMQFILADKGEFQATLGNMAVLLSEQSLKANLNSMGFINGYGHSPDRIEIRLVEGKSAIENSNITWDMIQTILNCVELSARMAMGDSWRIDSERIYFDHIKKLLEDGKDIVCHIGDGRGKWTDETVYMPISDWLCGKRDSYYISDSDDDGIYLKPIDDYITDFNITRELISRIGELYPESEDDDIYSSDQYGGYTSQDDFDPFAPQPSTTKPSIEDDDFDPFANDIGMP